MFSSIFKFCCPDPYTPMYYFWRGATTVMSFIILMDSVKLKIWSWHEWFWLVIFVLCVTPPYKDKRDGN